MRRLLLLTLLLPAWPAWAEDDVAKTMKRLGVEETRFRVVDKKSAEAREAEDPAGVDLPLLDTKHREEGRQYLDPFIGREVYPEVSARLSTGFVTRRIANGDEPHGRDGKMTLGGRVDLSAWVLDVRIPFDTDRPIQERSVELVLKAPFSAGHHSFAPMLVFHAPIAEGLDRSVAELALGYHYARAGFGLKLEVSAFNATHLRTRGPQSAGMVGYNGVLSYLIGDVVGIVVEADGTTALSERSSAAKPKVGDSVLRLAPGLRFFPSDAGFAVGISGLLTFVPNGYLGMSRDQGVLLDVGYTFL